MISLTRHNQTDCKRDLGHHPTCRTEMHQGKARVGHPHMARSNLKTQHKPMKQVKEMALLHQTQAAHQLDRARQRLEMNSSHNGQGQRHCLPVFQTSCVQSIQTTRSSLNGGKPLERRLCVTSRMLRLLRLDWHLHIRLRRLRLRHQLPARKRRQETVQTRTLKQTISKMKVVCCTPINL